LHKIDLRSHTTNQITPQRDGATRAKHWLDIVWSLSPEHFPLHRFLYVVARHELIEFNDAVNDGTKECYLFDYPLFLFI
jgi:hypothetical protein